MNPRLQELTGAEAGVFFPLPGEGSFIGAISVLWTRPRARLESFARQAIELLSLEAGRVLERLRATRDLQRQAERDPLTGLLNRRSLQNALETAGPVDALVLIDLDHFKAVNDRYGHVAGDKVLVSFAECLQSAARGSDSVARFGGEEFALLLREGGPDGAAAVIERLRALWAKTNPPTTFSAGIAQRRRNESVSDALQRADEALYAAKKAGRNRTELAHH
jgi:diguanylate cyclase (GGDEF)-like protein